MNPGEAGELVGRLLFYVLLLVAVLWLVRSVSRRARRPRRDTTPGRRR